MAEDLYPGSPAYGSRKRSPAAGTDAPFPDLASEEDSPALGSQEPSPAGPPVVPGRLGDPRLAALARQRATPAPGQPSGGGDQRADTLRRLAGQEGTELPLKLSPEDIDRMGMYRSPLDEQSGAVWPSWEQALSDLGGMANDSDPAFSPDQYQTHVNNLIDYLKGTGQLTETNGEIDAQDITPEQHKQVQQMLQGLQRARGLIGAQADQR